MLLGVSREMSRLYLQNVFCISPTENNRIMRAGLSLDFLESVSKLLFIGAGKGWLEMGYAASLAAVWLVAGCSGSAHGWVFPAFPTC